LVGAVVVTEQWEDHPLPVRIELDQRRGRVRLGWSLPTPPLWRNEHGRR
jgi:hypothetical protein